MSDHWNAVYASRSDQEVSWFETEPSTSLELLDLLGVSPADSVLDVGGGRSTLVDRLAERGHRDLSVLDLSDTALAAVSSRLAPGAVRTIVADVTTWRPTRRFDVWHDRATLHFLDAEHVGAYVATLHDALSLHGGVVLGVFAPDGPDSCSGLPVTRYDAAGLTTLLGEQFTVVHQRRTSHTTPWGSRQSFQWIAARRQVEA